MLQLLLQFSLNQVYSHSGAEPHSDPALVSSIACFEPKVVDSHFEEFVLKCLSYVMI